MSFRYNGLNDIMVIVKNGLKHEINDVEKKCLIISSRFEMYFVICFSSQ